MTREELQSNTISFIRFPLAVGVVMIHSWCGIPAVSYKHLPNPDMPVFSYIAYFFSVILPRIAVPLFFAIAGYLFFKSVTSFTFQTYIGKLRKRFKTLFVPYIFWNLLVILITFAVQTFTSYYHDQPLVKDYSVGDWFWALFYYNNIGTDGTNLVFQSQPAAFQLWFIRDLMIIMLFSPLVYVLCKRLKLWFIIPLSLLWLNEFWYLGFNVRDYLDRNVVFFFPLGAYFGIHKIDFIAVAKRWGKLALIVYAAMAVLDLIFENCWLRGFHDRILIITGIVGAIYVVSTQIERGKWHVNTFLDKSSFFVFAAHGLLMKTVLYFIFEKHQVGEITTTLLYFLVPIATILICLGLYWCLRRYCKPLMPIITGGR